MTFDVNSRNQVTVIGHVGQDLEVREIPGKDKDDAPRKVVNMSVCTNEAFIPESGDPVEKPVWHNVVAWGPLAERLVKSGLKKGSRVVVQGRMKYDPQEKEVDGVIHHYHNAVIEAEFSLNLSSKPEESAKN